MVNIEERHESEQFDSADGEFGRHDVNPAAAGDRLSGPDGTWETPQPVRATVKCDVDAAGFYGMFGAAAPLLSIRVNPTTRPTHLVPGQPLLHRLVQLRIAGAQAPQVRVQISG